MIGKVALDLLRQALSRKWFLGLGIAITLGLAGIGLSLRMDVVDGALAGTRFFGQVVSRDIVSAEVALRPVFVVATYLVFYGFSGFMILACADFAPALLSPGRIEHTLALPIRRFELLTGTYLGVVSLAFVATLYAAGGLCLLLGLKTGVWSFWPVLGGLFTGLGFAAVYAAMLLAALLVRSAALSAAAGAVLFAAGIVAGNREAIMPAMDPGIGRALTGAVTAVLPRLSGLPALAASFSRGESASVAAVAPLLGGVTLFALGMLLVGVWLFEQKDY